MSTFEYHETNMITAGADEHTRQLSTKHLVHKWDQALVLWYGLHWRVLDGLPATSFDRRRLPSFDLVQLLHVHTVEKMSQELVRILLLELYT